MTSANQEGTGQRVAGSVLGGTGGIACRHTARGKGEITESFHVSKARDRRWIMSWWAKCGAVDEGVIEDLNDITEGEPRTAAREARFSGQGEDEGWERSANGEPTARGSVFKGR